MGGPNPDALCRVDRPSAFLGLDEFDAAVFAGRRDEREQSRALFRDRGPVVVHQAIAAGNAEAAPEGAASMLSR